MRASPAPHLQPGTVVDERFELLALCGAGGMGCVYTARDLTNNQTVALKTLVSATGSTERFEREAAVLAKLSHPNVVAYVASGRTVEGAPWLAMEWLDGEDLAARLERGPLSIEQTLALGRAVASALGAAHEQSLVHRDIKPANIFLPAGSVDDAKVLDFGIVRRLDSARATATGTLIGTLGYMAPEQARGHVDVSAAADLHSLGCVLYECIAGSPAFPGDHAIAILAKVLLETPTPLGELGLTVEVPSWLATLVSRLLEKDPARRPANAEAVLSALRSSGDTLAPPPPAPPARAVVGGTEHALVSLVFVSGAASGVGDTVVASDEDVTRSQIAAVLAEHGGRPHTIVGGTQFATVVVDGTARDHARQAARCALAVRALASDIGIALATGRIPEGRAFGEGIDRGAALVRIDPAARPEPSAIDIDETTAALVRDDFHVVAHDGRWFLLGPKHERVRMPHEMLCVGREREIAAVGAFMEESFSEKVARAALLVGPPGIGKSLLVDVVLGGAAAVGRRVWRTEADPVGAGAPHRLIAQLTLSAAGLRGGETSDEKLSALRALARRFVPRQAEAVARPLATLCGVAVDGWDGQDDARPFADTVRKAWDDLVAGALAEGPLTLVLEDLHWADWPSIRLIGQSLKRYASEGAGSAPLFVLATARPNVHEVFPSLWAERPVQETRLAELGRRAATRLVKARLGPDVDPDVVRAIVERAGGNAFFLVELTRVVAAGHDVGTIPETIIGVVEARLRSFDAEDRRSLRAASVFGQHFLAGAVGHLLGAEDVESLAPRLDALVDRDLLRHDGEGQYAFAHGLIRDAAYAMLDEEDRRSAHLAAAAWLEQEGVADVASLAHHVEQGADVARAIECRVLAARDALDAGDFAASIAHGERALALGAQGETRGRILVHRAEAMFYSGDPTEQPVALAKEAMRLLRPGSEAWVWASRVIVGVGLVKSAKPIS